MRSLLAAAASLMLGFMSPAFADTTEGKVQRVNAEAMTVVLDDGKTYRLPPEMDMTVIEEGIEIIVAYDVGADGTNQITDMEILQ